MINAGKWFAEWNQPIAFVAPVISIHVVEGIPWMIGRSLLFVQPRKSLHRLGG